MLYIRRKSDGEVFPVYGTERDVQQMPARGWTETVTWFLIWDKNEYNGQYEWVWVTGTMYEPYTEL